MKWTVPKIWEGGDVWIIGGGPSVAKQFKIPKEICDKVLLKQLPLSAYSPYMEAIHKKHVIGINVAYLIGNWIDMAFFGDNNFFLKHKERLVHFPGLKVSCCPFVQPYPWVKYLEKDSHASRGITNNPKMVSWNSNSGSAAISVAYNAGAKRIFLLGFDMKFDETQHQHFHSEYRSAPTLAGTGNPNRNPFRKHLLGFPTIARHAKLFGIQIYNVCPDSAITEFPKITLEQALLL